MPADLENILSINFQIPLKALNAGEFISRGTGIHPSRIITSYEIIFVTKGTLKIFEEDKIYHLEPGSALLLFPNKHHGGVETYPVNLSFYWVHFDLHNSDNAEKKNFTQIANFAKISNQIGMTELFRHFINDQESGNCNLIQQSLLIMQMLVEISFNNSNIPNPRNHLVEQAMQYIKLNLKELSGTAEVAKELQCNPDYLGRQFKKYTNRTITEEIHRQRINHAKKLLLDTVMNIAEIANASGFDDSVYFRKIFKRLNSVSPKNYRQQYSRISINTEY